MTKIEWTHPPSFKGDVWNPVVGCTHHGAGCLNCYADELHTKRHKAYIKHGGVYPKNGKPMPAQYAHPFEKVPLLPERLDAPLRRRMPTCYFVNSVSDLFHKDVPFEFIAAVYGVMAACPQHRFIVLTKRPERMLEFFEWLDLEAEAAEAEHPNRAKHWYRFHVIQWEAARELGEVADDLLVGVRAMARMEWPLPNVWHGTSIANQKDADRNIPIILKVPSAIRFISAEPLLGPVDGPGWQLWLDSGSPPPKQTAFTRKHWAPQWTIVGGESGPGARPCDIAWIRSIIQQCKAAGVKCFVKQLGKNPWLDGIGYALHQASPDYIPRKPGKWADPQFWPEDVRVREYPEASA